MEDLTRVVVDNGRSDANFAELQLLEGANDAFTHAAELGTITLESLASGITRLLRSEDVRN